MVKTPSSSSRGPSQISLPSSVRITRSSSSSAATKRAIGSSCLGGMKNGPIWGGVAGRKGKSWLSPSSVSFLKSVMSILISPPSSLGDMLWFPLDGFGQDLFLSALFESRSPYFRPILSLSFKTIPTNFTVSFYGLLLNSIFSKNECDFVTWNNYSYIPGPMHQFVQYRKPRLGSSMCNRVVKE